MNNFINVKEQEAQRVLVTGVCNSRVIAINPDRETLAEIVGKSEEDIKDPSYLSLGKEGNQVVRVDIWMRPAEGTQYYDGEKNKYLDFNEPYKMSIFLSDIERESAAGNKVVINGKVQTTWAKSVEEAIEKTNKMGIKFFDETSARFAKQGEDQLYDFFAKYVNANLKDEKTNLVFNDFDAILSGDMSELNAIVDVKNKEDKTINVLLGVHNGVYQEVYSGAFERGSRKTFQALIQKAGDTYNSFRADYGGESQLKAFVRPTPNSSSSITENSSENSLGSSEPQDDDSPF